MAGWNAKRTAVFKEAFNDFLKHVWIDSKETGESRLVLYDAQKRFLRGVFEGLENDIHDFTILKARQLGISTVCRVLIVFWAFMHRGLRVALVYDTESNKEDARKEIELLLARLPDSHRIPTSGHNRNQLDLENGSRISYFVAGIKKSKGSGGLGRSRGINCSANTECSSWADIEGLRSYQRSLAQQYPDRLFIWESTARGFNIFYDLWEEAKADDLTKKAIFIGWWAKEIYAIEKGTPLFERYGTAEVTEDEQKKIDEVYRLYGHSVSIEQLAWYRHEYDPNKEADGREHAGQDILTQELPWTESDAFLLSGSQFFPADKLTEARKKASPLKVNGFNYFMTQEFTATIIEPARHSRHAWLKIWDEPDPQGVYVIGCDPAYGSSEDSFNSVAQVLRCYADGVEQVAEFCSVEPDTSQFAWAITHLCGAYANCRFLLELNGPGHAVWNEIKSLKNLIGMGYLREAAEEKNLTSIFRNVREYVWSKEDSLNKNPSAFHWETTTKRKVQIFERLKALFNTGQVIIKSTECLREMQKVVRDGDSIKGEGSSKYDRVMALALAVRAWEDGERRALTSQGRTKEIEAKRKEFTIYDLNKIWQEGVIGDFFNRSRNDRIRATRLAKRQGRWNW